MFNFYLISNNKLVVSNKPLDIIKKKFGYKFEIVNSVKEESSIDLVVGRVSRQYNVKEVVIWNVVKRVLSEERKRQIALSKIGKPRDQATREKISKALKGRSNFQGKKHSEATKKIMAEKKLGNDHVKDRFWAHDPRGRKEKRLKSRQDLPHDMSFGRDYYSVEPGLCQFRLNKPWSKVIR